MFWLIRGPGHSGRKRCVTDGPRAQLWTERPRAAPASVKLSQAPTVTLLPLAHLLLQSHGQTPPLPSGLP